MPFRIANYAKMVSPSSFNSAGRIYKSQESSALYLDVWFEQ